MHIRYFATNRDGENLGKNITRNKRISLQKSGYHWIDTSKYMSYYLATTDSNRIHHSSIIVESKTKIFDKFLNKESIKNIIICIHGFNVELNEAITSFSVLSDTLNSISQLKNKIIVDPLAQEHQLDNEKGLTGVIGFSWPSNGSVFHYDSDRKDASYSASPLANMISIIKSNNPNARIHIIAHSMGNFLVCRMLEMLVNKQIFTIVQVENRHNQKELIDKEISRRGDGGDKNFFIDNFIMLAPDVERRHITQCDQHGEVNDDNTINSTSSYLGPFYAGLHHLVGGNHLFYSRYDTALKLSREEKELFREKPNELWRKFTFRGVDPNNLWENSLGLNPAPKLSPSNLYSYNASTMSNRTIDHGDYFDTPAIVEKIADLIINYE